jgi:hypothetical protein
MVITKRTANAIVLSPPISLLDRSARVKRIRHALVISMTALVGYLDLTEFINKQAVEYWVQRVRCRVHVSYPVST